MSMTINATANATWKRLSSQYVVTAAGLALAVCMGVALGGGESGLQGRPGRASNELAASIGGAADFGPQWYVFHLVGSDEQRHALIESAASDGLPSDRAWVVVIRSLEDELSVAATQAEQTYLGNIVEVVDLRVR